MSSDGNDRSICDLLTSREVEDRNSVGTILGHSYDRGVRDLVQPPEAKRVQGWALPSDSDDCFVAYRFALLEAQRLQMHTFVGAPDDGGIRDLLICFFAFC